MALSTIIVFRLESMLQWHTCISYFRSAVLELNASFIRTMTVTGCTMRQINDV